MTPCCAWFSLGRRDDELRVFVGNQITLIFWVLHCYLFTEVTNKTFQSFDKFIRGLNEAFGQKNKLERWWKCCRSDSHTYTFEHSQTPLGPPQRCYQVFLVILLAEVLHTLFNCGNTTRTLSCFTSSEQRGAQELPRLKSAYLYLQYDPVLPAAVVLLWTSPRLSWRWETVMFPWLDGPSTQQMYKLAKASLCAGEKETSFSKLWDPLIGVQPTVMFSKSRCLLCTVSHSFLIFSLTFSTSFAVSWSWWVEHSWSNSRSLIISSRQDLSRSMFRRSRLRMYIRAAVHRARFWKTKRKPFFLPMDGHEKGNLHFLKNSEFTDRVLSSVAQNFEDLGHFPSCSQVHPEAGHGTPRGQADYTEQRKG